MKKVSGKIRISRKKNNIEIDCLTFADNLTILSDSTDDSIRQINIDKRVAKEKKIGPKN